MRARVPLAVCPPAGGGGLIRLDRFSPNFNNAESIGFVDVAPYPAYGYIYPFPPEVVANLAYFFTFHYKEPRNIQSYIAPIRKSMIAWSEAYATSDLFFVDKGEQLLIWDLRPGTATPLTVIDCAAHRALAYEAAVKSVVLLKNTNNILPIRADVRRIAVVGPTATNLDVLHGNYCGLNDSMRTLLEGIVGRVPEGTNVEYRPGCALNQPTINPLDRTVLKAAQADVTIACMGLSPWLEGEESDAILATNGGDRLDITLPANQVEFVKRLVDAGANVVLVLTGGSPIALGELADLVEAAVFVWYPGQEGGKAVADVLFGTAAPSGKLPLTFPESIAQLPSFEDYSMVGRTYRYSTAEPLYPFGLGLSYTRFRYTDLALARETVAAGESLPCRVTLSNTGTVAADEVAQFYLTDLEASVPVPLCTLIGFQRVRVAPGESKSLAFTVSPDMMMLVDDEGKQRLEPGQFRVTVGGCSPSARGVALGAPEPVSKVFTVAPRP